MKTIKNYHYEYFKVDYAFLPFPKRGGRYNLAEWGRVTSTIEISLASGRGECQNINDLYPYVVKANKHLIDVFEPYNELRSGWLLRNIFGHHSRANIYFSFKPWNTETDFSDVKNRTHENVVLHLSNGLKRLVEEVNGHLDFVYDNAIWDADSLEAFQAALKKHDGSRHDLIGRDYETYIERKFLRGIKKPYSVYRTPENTKLYDTLPYILKRLDHITTSNLLEQVVRNEVPAKTFLTLLAQSHRSQVEKEVEAWKKDLKALKKYIGILHEHFVVKKWVLTQGNLTRALGQYQDRYSSQSILFLKDLSHGVRGGDLNLDGLYQLYRKVLSISEAELRAYLEKQDQPGGYYFIKPQNWIKENTLDELYHYKPQKAVPSLSQAQAQRLRLMKMKLSLKTT